MNEFVDIPELNSKYQINKIGQIKSCKTQRILKHRLNSTGYPCVTLYENEEPSVYMIHRLIARTFIPLVEGKYYVNHKNHNKEDYSIENLEWCTLKENSKHAFKNTKSNKPIIKIGKENAKLIRIDFDNGVLVTTLAEKYKTSIKTIYDIIQYKIYREEGFYPITGKLSIHNFTNF